MCMPRVEMDRLQELVRLHRMKTGCREVARLLAISPNTERVYRKALESAGLLAGAADDVPPLETIKAAVGAVIKPAEPPQQTSSVERWEATIVELAKKGLGPRAIYDRLRLDDATFGGTYWAVRRLVRRLRKQQGVRAEDVAIAVDTRPGEVAQVDFGYVGRLWDATTGSLRKAWVFVMVLGYSRHMFAKIVFDQKVSTWLQLHVDAFAALDGVVETVVPDNLKAAVVRAAFGADGTSALNRSYRELARHYGFKVDPAPPRAPKKKGKCESGVKYVKRNFFAGRDGADAVDTQRELDRWVRQIAGTRIHGSTGLRPLEVFEAEERGALLPLPSRRWEPLEWRHARVHIDCHVNFDGRLYSAPWRLCGQKVWLRATATTVDLYFDDELVATHARHGRDRRATIESHLPDHRAPLRHRSRAFWQERADRIGPDVGAYVREVFDSDDVLSMLRTVQAIVTHLEKFPVERARAACRRASHFAAYKYGAIKNILLRGLDLEPLPSTAPPPQPTQLPFRFARSVNELIHPEETHATK